MNLLLCLCVQIPFGRGLLQRGIQSYLVNGAQAGSGNIQANPHVLLYPIEFLAELIHFESAFRAPFRVRDVVPHHRFLSGNLTNL